MRLVKNKIYLVFFNKGWTQAIYKNTGNGRCFFKTDKTVISVPWEDVIYDVIYCPEEDYSIGKVKDDSLFIRILKKIFRPKNKTSKEEQGTSTSEHLKEISYFYDKGEYKEALEYMDSMRDDELQVTVMIKMKAAIEEKLNEH